MKKLAVDSDRIDSDQTQRLELLHRVLSSSLFERSTRLREFLRYVGIEAIRHGATSIHEQQIGAAVFGRPAFYDTSQDNIVRVNATELRKRLDVYFATDGASEPIVISLPRGSYAPIFSPRDADELLTEAAETHAEPETSSLASIPHPSASVQTDGTTFPVSSTPVAHSLWLVLALAALVASLALVAVLGWKLRSQSHQLDAWESRPALRLFWSNFLTPGSTTDVVLADTSFSVAQDLTHYKADLSDYLNFHYQQMAEETYEQKGQHGVAGALHLLFNRNSGSISDFRTAQDILNLAPGSPVLKLHSSRELSGNAMRHDSTILIGSNRSNPWVDLYKDKLDFNFQPALSGATDITVTINQPQPGQQASYSTTGGDSRREGYCILAFLPNLSGEGNALIIAGTDAQATEAGGEFLTHETTMEALLKLAHRNSFPHFQLLLRTSRLADTPVSSAIVNFRVLKD